MADSCVSDGCPSAATYAYLPQPYKIDGRFVMPWPGFKLPTAGGLMKYFATSKDESNIPSTEVRYCIDHLLPALPGMYDV